MVSSQISLALLSGIISGLLSSLIVFVVVKYWNSVVVPWYEQRVYKDVPIGGKWAAEGVEREVPFVEDVIVRQKAHRVSGEIIYKGERETIEYEFDGEFKNLILTARYWTKRQSTLSRGTFTLMLRDEGKTLEGYYAGYLGKEDVNEVVGGPYKWSRP